MNMETIFDYLVSPYYDDEYDDEEEYFDEEYEVTEEQTEQIKEWLFKALGEEKYNQVSHLNVSYYDNGVRRVRCYDVNGNIMFGYLYQRGRDN